MYLIKFVKFGFEKKNATYYRKGVLRNSWRSFSLNFYLGNKKSWLKKATLTLAPNTLPTVTGCGKRPDLHTYAPESNCRQRPQRRGLAYPAAQPQPQPRFFYSTMRRSPAAASREIGTRSSRHTLPRCSAANARASAVAPGIAAYAHRAPRTAAARQPSGRPLVGEKRTRTSALCRRSRFCGAPPRALDRSAWIL
jgi:hypothetical protein